MNTTDDPKEHMIKARVNDEMHSYLLDRCRTEGCTVSWYIRDMIRRDMKGYGGYTDNCLLDNLKQKIPKK